MDSRLLRSVAYTVRSARESLQELLRGEANSPLRTSVVLRNKLSLPLFPSANPKGLDDQEH